MSVATAALSQSAPPRMGPDSSRLMNPWRKLNLKVEGVLLELETNLREDFTILLGPSLLKVPKSAEQTPKDNQVNVKLGR